MRHTTQDPRRAVAVAVLAVATVALIATSPPQEPQHRIGGRDSETVQFAVDAPIVTVPLTVEASDEAIWSDDPAVPVRSARLTAQAGLMRQSGSTKPSLGTDAPILRVTLLDPTGQPLVRDDRYGPSSIEVDFRAFCEEPQDCAVTYTMLVEWLNPTAASFEAVLSATVETIVEGPEVLPPGAEARVEFGTVESVAADVLRGNVAVEPIRLSAERPMVTWTIAIVPNEAAEAVRLGWPVEPRGTISLFVEVPDAEEESFAYRQPPVSLVVFGGEREVVLDPGNGRIVHALDPFAECGDTPCPQEVTLVAAWEGDEDAPAVDIAWSIDAGIAFIGGEAAPSGAEVAVRMDSQVDVVAAGDSLRASAAGTLTITGAERERRSTSLDLFVPAAALKPELIGGPIPALVAKLTASSTSAGGIGDETRIVLRAMPIGDPAHVAVPAPDSGSATVRFRPAPACRSGHVCGVDVGLSGSASRTGGRVDEDAELVVAWELEIVLLYPTGVRAPFGVEIGLSDGAP